MEGWKIPCSYFSLDQNPIEPVAGGAGIARYRTPHSRPSPEARRARRDWTVPRGSSAGAHALTPQPRIPRMGTSGEKFEPDAEIRKIEYQPGHTYTHAPCTRACGKSVISLRRCPGTACECGNWLLCPLRIQIFGCFSWVARRFRLVSLWKSRQTCQTLLEWFSVRARPAVSMGARPWMSGYTVWLCCLRSAT